MSDIYVRFKEFCDNEGETWYTFVKYDEESKNNINILMKICNFFEEINEEDNSHSYKKNDDGSIRFYSQDEVDMYLDINEQENTTYMEEYSIGVIEDFEFDTLDLDDEDLMDEIDSFIYKRSCYK